MRTLAAYGVDSLALTRPLKPHDDPPGLPLWAKRARCAALAAGAANLRDRICRSHPADAGPGGCRARSTRARHPCYPVFASTDHVNTTARRHDSSSTEVRL